MDLIVGQDYAKLSEEAAGLVAGVVRAGPKAVLGLPTGETPMGLYAALARVCKKQGLDFSGVTTFNLDEYLGLPLDHPQSFASYMRRHVWGRINLQPSRAHIPASCPEDPAEECSRYEDLIRGAGGLDLVVLGLGDNGHIAFNEPGTQWETLTHVATLTLETRQKAAQDFGSVDAVPRQAITVGIKTIMRARRVLLLASGARKAEVLARALLGPVTPDLPATVLQLHPSLVVVADRLAASRVP